MERIVECGEHGDQPATFVCQHLVQSLRSEEPVGFYCSMESDELRPDAWCRACEVRRLESSDTGEWNDESEEFAGVTLLCGACYDRAKLLNTGGPI